MIAAGYDPAGAPGCLRRSAVNQRLQARVQGRTNRQTPEWASTHPLSENRMQQALQWARTSGRLGTGLRNRDIFLSELEGTFVDDDPAQGIIDGASFTHPDLRIQFSVPPGYLMSNGTYAVTISGSAGKAQFSGGRYSGTLDNYILAVFGKLTRGQLQIAIPPPQRTVINGMPAAFTTARVQTSSGPIDVSVVAYQWDAQRVYHFVMLTPGGSGIGPFTPMVNSLRKITAGGSGGHPAADHPCGDGRAGRHRAVTGEQDGLPRFQARPIPFAQRTRAPTADSCPGRRSSWSSLGPAARLSPRCRTATLILPHMPLVPPPNA